MSHELTRRAFLQSSAYAGLGLSTLSLWGCGGGGGNDPAPGGGGSTPPPPPPVADEYRALVGVFLFGGNDAYNWLVPTTQAKYDPYAAARLDLAIPRDQLLALNGVAADGAAYGLHPSCPELRDLFNGGQAALLANVGSLTFPTAQADYAAGRVPPRLFSHNDQQDQWQTARPDASSQTGWAGRLADVLGSLNGSAELPFNLSIAGNNLLQRGAGSAPFSIASSGPQQLTQLSATSSGTRPRRQAFDQLRGLPAAHVFERTYANTLDRGIRLNALLDAQLASAPALSTAFPANNPLAAQLNMVARLISIRSALGMKRQLFFVSLGGFDTHDAQATDQPVLLQRVSQALKAFYDATVELGVASNVTSFTLSDFGRSLTVNGKGTDHGWSSHQIIVGGAVNGQRIYGTPPSLVAGGSDDTRGGRFIPSTAVDEYAATLARWLGVADSDLNGVLPNLPRFASRDLGFMR